MAGKSKKDIKKIVAEVARQSESTEEKPEEFIQLVVFELDKEEYAVNITDLREIIKIPEITPIPNAPEFIRGILNLRGKIVVVVDLEKRFNLVRENKVEPKHIIIAEVDENIFGVIVDKVTEILRVPISAIHPTPALVSAKIHQDYLKGVVVLYEKEGPKKLTKEECEAFLAELKSEKGRKSRARLLILLDLPKLLSEKELLKVGDQIKEAVK